MIETATPESVPSYRNYETDKPAVEATPPVPIQDMEDSAPKRVRLTTTRMRNLDSSLTSAIAAIDRTYSHISDMLEGRDDDNSPAVLALRELWNEITEGNYRNAEQVSRSLVATFESFA